MVAFDPAVDYWVGNSAMSKLITYSQSPESDTFSLPDLKQRSS